MGCLVSTYPMFSSLYLVLGKLASALGSGTRHGQGICVWLSLILSLLKQLPSFPSPEGQISVVNMHTGPLGCKLSDSDGPYITIQNGYELEDCHLLWGFCTCEFQGKVSLYPGVLFPGSSWAPKIKDAQDPCKIWVQLEGGSACSTQRSSLKSQWKDPQVMVPTSWEFMVCEKNHLQLVRVWNLQIMKGQLCILCQNCCGQNSVPNRRTQSLVEHHMLRPKVN